MGLEENDIKQIKVEDRVAQMITSDIQCVEVPIPHYTEIETHMLLHIGHISCSWFSKVKHLSLCCFD